MVGFFKKIFSKLSGNDKEGIPIIRAENAHFKIKINKIPTNFLKKESINNLKKKLTEYLLTHFEVVDILLNFEGEKIKKFSIDCKGNKANSDMGYEISFTQSLGNIVNSFINECFIIELEFQKYNKQKTDEYIKVELSRE